MRYYRFDRTEGGEWPSATRRPEWLQPGAIVRVARSNSRLPGAVFNTETCEWVSPVWVECDDPRSSPEARDE